MNAWRDESSYSQSDPHPREPRTWRLELGRRGVAVVVTRYYGAPGWVMHFHAFHVEAHHLRATEIVDAKAEALRIAQNMLAEALGACDYARGES